MHFVNFKPDGWLWYFPQYHAVMFALVILNIGLMLVVIVLLGMSLIKLTALVDQTSATVCPCCHQKTLSTIQRCATPECKFIRMQNTVTRAQETLHNKHVMFSAR